MKKIEEKMVDAVKNGKNFCEGNTCVVVSNGITKVFLCGNKIYEKKNGKEKFFHCGWYTNVTASRLRALGANILFSPGNYIRFI